MIRHLAIGSILIVALSACEMTVRFTTQLEEDGSGSFAVGVVLDQAARDTFDAVAQRTGDPANGIGAIVSLYDGLALAGWDVERSEPNGGLSYQARRAFTDPDDFGRVLGELRSARSAEGTGLSGLLFGIDVSNQRSFFRSTAGFTGVLDMSGIDPTPFGERLAAELQQRLRIEIRAHLPGAISGIEGAATVGDGVIVWRPVFGARAAFGASASSLRVGNLLLIMLPVLVALGVLGWVLIGRRRGRDQEGEPALEELLVLAPEPNGRNGRAPATVATGTTLPIGHTMEIDLGEVTQSEGASED